MGAFSKSLILAMWNPSVTGPSHNVVWKQGFVVYLLVWKKWMNNPVVCIVDDQRSYDVTLMYKMSLSNGNRRNITVYQCIRTRDIGYTR